MPRTLLASLVLLVLPGLTQAQDMPLSQILLPGEEWQPIGLGFKTIEGMWIDAQGNIHVLDPSNNDHNVTVLAPDGAVLRGQKMTPEPGFAVTTQGGRFVYSTHPGRKTVRLHDTETNTTRELNVPLAEPSGLVLWPDQSTLVAGDAGGKYLWAFRIEKDGSLTCPEPYYPLRMRPGETASHVQGLTVDSAGRVYATTPLGLQIFDPTGRLSGVLLNPSRTAPSVVAFAGSDRDLLVMACGNTVYARRLQARGVSLLRR